MNDDFRAKVAAQLGLPPDADDDALVSAAAELSYRSKIAAALGVAVDADEETFLKAARGLVEASRRAVKEVRLHPADRSAIDATVAASSPEALRERQVLDDMGLPVAQVPAPVVIEKGVSPADWTPRQAQDNMLRRLGRSFWPGTEAPPKGDVVFYPSPNDPYRWDESAGRFVEKNPYKEIP